MLDTIAELVRTLLEQLNTRPGKRSTLDDLAAPAQKEKALIELRQVVSDLRARVNQDQLDGSELVLGCRRVLNLWVNSGGSSLDDPVITFTGIESQSDHVLGGSQVRVGRDVDHVRFEPGSAAEQEEVEEIGRFFRESFVNAVNSLSSHLDGS